MPGLIHLSPHVFSVGGMQTLARRNLALDRTRGTESRPLSLFDRPDPTVRPESCLGARGWWNLRTLRGRLVRRLPEPGATIIYYNGWGLPILADRDQAARRLVFLATDWPGFAPAVTAMAPWCDGFVCVSDELVAKVRATIPPFPAERILAVPLAAESFPPREPRRPDPARPLVVGFVARLERDQKRADLLPTLIQATRRTGIAVRWEIVGDGSERRSLERALAGTNGVTFHGMTHGDGYRRIVGQLDLIVFMSEYEGAPLAMLDAMAAGVIPVFPSIGGMAERYAAAVAPGCVYPAGDIGAAAQRIAILAQEPNRTELDRRCRELVAGHSPAAYAAAYERAVEGLMSAPRISRVGGLRKPQLTDWLPLAIVKRTCPDVIWR